MDETRLHKGRGAVSNPGSRFEPTRSVAVDDGWGSDAGEDEEWPDPAPRTTFLPDRTRNLIATNSSPDIPFDQSINPYKGCEHGCVYCYARPTHAFLDLSPGLDFETRIFYKTNPVERLREALDAPGYQCRPLAMGTNTDPYQPGEKQYRVTRQVLETLLAYRHPVTITTKGALVLRDLDLLRELAAARLVSVAVSITTLDSALKTKLEPRTASPGARLRTVRELAAAKVPVGTMVAPIIPVINDGEIERIVERAAEAGAEFAGYVVLRLPLEVQPLFVEWLAEHYPGKAEHVMNRVRDLHGGKAYEPQWGTRMSGKGPFASLIAKRFEIARRKHGMEKSSRRALRTDLFRPTQGQLF